MPSPTHTLALAALILAAPALAADAVAQTTAAPLALTGGTIYPAPDRPAIRDARDPAP